MTCNFIQDCLITRWLWSLEL